jgi:ATP-binding cassette subfamily B protein
MHLPNAAILDDINSFPKKFDTMLGERGITLSGGQKQRVSIARAIIGNPAILIFDDCLSAVDTQTEEKILNNLKKVMRNKTTIIISHRVSSVKHADEIIVSKTEPWLSVAPIINCFESLLFTGSFTKSKWRKKK